MILVDSNIPMYLVGAPHPHKADAQHALERLIAERRRLVTDAEVFQEILHRYAAIDRREAIQPAFEALRGVVDEVLPIVEADVLRAKDLLGTHLAITARDAIHVAVMANHDIEKVLSFDRGFDSVAAVERLPARR
ncbi:MAG: type II toxin-antitoxin system VapC family toxin [Candidatus Dormibacteria bacterium]